MLKQLSVHSSPSNDYIPNGFGGAACGWERHRTAAHNKGSVFDVFHVVSPLSASRFVQVGGGTDGGEHDLHGGDIGRQDVGSSSKGMQRLWSEAVSDPGEVEIPPYTSRTPAKPTMAL